MPNPLPVNRRGVRNYCQATCRVDPRTGHVLAVVEPIDARHFTAYKRATITGAARRAVERFRREHDLPAGPVRLMHVEDVADDQGVRAAVFTAGPPYGSTVDTLDIAPTYARDWNAPSPENAGDTPG